MIRNALTVDVEDYFHVSAFAESISRSDWNNHTLRVERNTHQLLDLFDERNVKATFFVLGWVADRQRSLIKEIADRGHEVACHGYSHQLVYNQTPELFQEWRADQLLAPGPQIQRNGNDSENGSYQNKAQHGN